METQVKKKQVSGAMASCSIVALPLALQQALAAAVVVDGVELQLSFYEEFVTVDELLTADVLAIYATDETFDRVLAWLPKLQPVLQRQSTMQPLLLLTPVAFSRSLSAAWAYGVCAHLPVCSDVSGVCHTLCHIAYSRQVQTQAKREIVALEAQLEQVGDHAMIAMSASHQLGEIIRFMEKSYRCSDFEALIERLHETLESLGVHGCGVIECDNTLMYFGDRERQPFLQRLIEHQRHLGRYVDLEHRTTLNFEKVTLMVRKMPPLGSEAYGRMKDVLFSLMEGLEARVKAISVARAAADAERTKHAFFAVMSHEMRTPMNAVCGFSSRLSKLSAGATLTVRDASALLHVHDKATHLQGIIEKMFELTRIGASLELRRLVVREACAGILHQYEVAAKAKGLGFSVHFQEESIVADLDERRLQHILANLLDNAVKYTDQGQVSVAVTTLASPTLGAQIQLIIADTGGGMPESVQKGIFTPLGQIDDFLHRGSEGIHLGLTMVRKFVLDLAGGVDFSSNPGQGTRFVVSLPQFVKDSKEEASVDAELF